MSLAFRLGTTLTCGLLAACEPPADDCMQLAEELERCDLPPAETACERLEPRERRLLIERFEESHCAAIREGDDNLDVKVCDLLDWTCAEPLFERPPGIPTRYPIVVVGGIDDGETFSWNPRVLAGIERAGPNRVLSVQPTAWAVTEVRARDIELAIEAFGAPKVNLLCYAVGGIDCRYLASPNGLASSRVASVTTIATPHRGTHVADRGLELSSGDNNAVLAALGGLEDPPDDTALQVVLGRLTPREMLAFNETIVDAPGVFYQSWAGVSHIFGQPYIPSEADLSRECRGPNNELLWARSGDGYDVMSAILAATAPFADAGLADDAAALLRPSDGMVAVSSAKWGRFRGCIPADHYDVIGQIGDAGVDPNSGFDAVPFHENVAVDLARRGL